MKPPSQQQRKDEATMTETKQYVKKVQEELTRFQDAMEELRELRSVADELKSFRKMIKVKRYD